MGRVREQTADERERSTSLGYELHLGTLSSINEDPLAALTDALAAVSRDGKGNVEQVGRGQVVRAPELVGADEPKNDCIALVEPDQVGLELERRHGDLEDLGLSLCWRCWRNGR